MRANTKKHDSKTEASSSLEQINRDFPDATTLATLASQPRFSKLAQAAAIKSAFLLWREAHWFVGEQKHRDSCFSRRLAPILERQPRSYPATFKDFLRLVVEGKDEAKQLRRWRLFHLWVMRCGGDFGRRGERIDTKKCPATEAELSQIDKYISKDRNTSFTQKVWEENAWAFRRWWEAQTKEARKLAGKARAAKSAAANANQPPPKPIRRQPQFHVLKIFP
jgi:hypothetical protein